MLLTLVEALMLSPCMVAIMLSVIMILVATDGSVLLERNTVPVIALC